MLAFLPVSRMSASDRPVLYFLSLSIAIFLIPLYHFLGTFLSNCSSFLIMQAVSIPAIPAIAPGSP